MRKILYTVLFLTAGLQAAAQMTTRVIRDSLFIPWELVYGPDGHIWFTQKNGYVCRMEPASGNIDTLYHETNTVVQGEGGMLGLALHPQFPSQPYVYVAYEYMQGSYKEKIVRYTYSNSALGSPQTLLDNISGGNIHNGCRLLIVGDKLFITTGDAGNSAHAQNINSLNGKILRINLDGSIPPDNPIPGSPLWSWGHRNSQGLVYANGKLYSSEHGPNNDDEVNIILKGRNFGWPSVEGYCNTSPEISFCNDSNVVEPIMAWTPTLAVAGLDYYNHATFPSLQHSLLMTTLKDNKLYQLKLNTAGDNIVNSSVISSVNFGRIRDLCISPDGRIYISTSNSSAGGGNRIDKIIELYDPVLAVGTAESTSHINIYPNPAGDKVTILLPPTATQATHVCTISDITGKTIIQTTLKETKTELSLGLLSPGSYLLTIADGNQVRHRGKIMKQ